MFEKLFGIKQKKSSLKNEIIGGIFTFITMCYILPVNAQMLSEGLHMDRTGVFVITALASFAISLFMGFFANVPMALSAGMGINAFLAYTVSNVIGGTWQQSMLILTISGILFFILSLTPLRKMIIESIPKDLKAIISAALGGFIMFVGLKNSGIITASSSTLVALGTLGDPAILVALIAVLVTIGFMFSKVKILNTLAIPFGILLAAVAGIITSEVMISVGALSNNNLDAAWKYTLEGPLKDVVTNLPIAPWRDMDVLKMFNPIETFSTIPHVFMYGLFDGYTIGQLGNDFVQMVQNPASYISIFSLIFVSLFVSTATLITVGSNIGLIDKEGKMVNYKRAVIADASGALVAAPLGTSSITCFVESNVGVSLGSRTGLSAIVTGLMFLLSVFIFPVFSIFIAGSVTVPALVCVGLLILKGGFEDLNFKDPLMVFTALIMTIFCILTYSISDGIGIGLIAYVIMMLFSKRGKEVGVPIYVITGLFVVAFIASTIIRFLPAGV